MALRFTMMDTEQLCKWLVGQNVSADVIANFRGTMLNCGCCVANLARRIMTLVVENEMEEEALVT